MPDARRLPSARPGRLCAALLLAALGGAPTAGAATPPSFFTADPAAEEEGRAAAAEAVSAARAGRANEAGRWAARATERFFRAGLGVDAAVVHAWAADALAGAGRPAEAATAQAECVVRLVGMGLGAHPWVAAGCAALAGHLEAAGRAEDALRALEAGAEVVEAPGFPDLVVAATLWQELGAHVWGVAGAGRALPAFDRALAWHRRIPPGREEELATAAFVAAACAQEAGDAARALRGHEEALAIRRRLHAGDAVEVAASLNATGMCLQGAGRAAEGLPLLEEALAVQERLVATGASDPRNLPILRNNLGNCLVSLGRPAEALPLFAAIAAEAGVLPPDDPSLPAIWNNHGLCLGALGRHEEARELFRRALDLVRRQGAGDGPEAAVYLHNEALVLNLVGRSEEALPLFEAALAMHRRLLPAGHPLLAQNEANLAFCLDCLGRPEEALPHHHAALAALRSALGPDNPALLAPLGNLALCQVRLGRREDGLATLREGLALGRRLRIPDRHALAANLGWLLLGVGRAEEAIPVLAEAVAEVEAIRGGARGLGEMERAAYVEHLGLFGAFPAMVRAQIAVGRAGEACTYLERGRARELLDLLERSEFDPLARALERARAAEDAAEVARLDGVAARVAAAEGEADRLRTSGDGPALAAARQRLEEALAARAQVLRDLVDLADAKGVETIQALLEPGELLVAYSLTIEDGVVLVVPPAGEGVVAYPLAWPPAPGRPEGGRDGGTGGAAGEGDGEREVTLGSLATEVGRVREAIGAEAGRGLLGRAPTPAARPDAVLATAGARLLAALVPPALGERLRAVERLFVVPHGAIHRLPLEVLPSPRGGAGRTWLDDGPPVAYVPSGSVLHWCRTRRAEQRRRPAQDVLVALGDPVYGAAPAGDSVLPDGSAPAGPGFPPVLPPLPGTRREVEDVAAAFAEAGRSPTLVRLLGPEATEARLAREAPRARFLHLATHGLVDETSRASHSALALTLPTAGGAGEDDGFLELIDLLEHWRDRLARCELVVLSACETQGGPLQKDEGVFALPWGFFYAGCPAVIASLWSVADESTAVLMADFYRRLLADPARDRLLAFTEARRTLKATHPDPRRWAPFVFVGDPK